MSYLISLVATVTLLFGVQSLALRSLRGGANKCESNYFSSLARIQSGVAGSPQVMLLGSSITGRLPDRRRGFAGVANLGCDGGSALDTLEAFDRGQLQPAPLLVIEGNTFYRALAGMESEISQAMRAPLFKAGLRIPLLGAAGRPSGFAYSWLMERRFGLAAAGGDGLSAGAPAGVAPAISELTPKEADLVTRVAAIMRRLEQRGSRCVVVILPPGVSEGTPNHRLPAAIARQAGVAWWNLADAIPPGAVRFTDGVHMDPPSATAVLATMVAGVKTDCLQGSLESRE